MGVASVGETWVSDSTQVATKHDLTRVVAQNDSDSTRNSTLVTWDSTWDSTITNRARIATRITCWQLNYGIFLLISGEDQKKSFPRPQSQFRNPWPNTFVAIQDSELDSSLYEH